MTRFLLGIAATIAVQLVGWDAIETTLSRANATLRAAYATIETRTETVRNHRGSK